MQEERHIKTGLIWYRNDLRVSDHEALKTACDNNERVLAVYCFDPRHYVFNNYGFKKTGRFRTRFLIESVRELKYNLKNLNISLLVYLDKPEEKIPELISTHSVTSIYYQKEWTQEEYDVEAALKTNISGVNLHSYYQQFLYSPNQIPYTSFNQIPKIFTEFRKACEKNASISNLIRTPSPFPKENLINSETSIPELIDLGLQEFQVDPRSVFPFKGGENQAWNRIRYYFWKTHKLKDYKNTRNGMTGIDYSSKLSAWLANGCTSPKLLYYEVKSFEKEIISNQSTYWFIFELIWRDFFKYISLKHGNTLFRQGGILIKPLKWNEDKKIIEQLIKGETQNDFINANMKEIAATGFMSNRGRQNVNSYWAKELKQDWRIGASYYESLLIDYDVHSNWGNWMYISGVGNDPRDRKFNIQSQAERYDPEKKFRKIWLER
ncbi:DASH family cryptochrome [Christiangramia salexigens]|uniref:Cryptochrome DASH n=1 Tax=Christiangramia salexigens TaxID=1913577 RepID=A0A1L3J803_9FLAO|nr:DASH family cryptochrome [Christiangramia salexigens]APG61266.1 deoxyribodipyrimidine photolyase [Christiangramia salexigens]